MVEYLNYSLLTSDVGGLIKLISFVRDQEPCIYSGAVSRLCTVLCCMVAIRHNCLFPQRQCKDLHTSFDIY
jgi:hypothetical protein